MRGSMYADESRTGYTRNCILLRLGLNSSWLFNCRFSYCHSAFALCHANEAQGTYYADVVFTGQ